MKEYLYEDIFTERRFKDFLDNGEEMDPDFLYDMAFGFKPREFWNSDHECFIYESYQYITEMYFVMKGKWTLSKEIKYHEAFENDDVLINKIVKIGNRYFLTLMDFE